MANIFAILTAIVLACAAFLAYQNMGKAEVEGRGYKGWITKTDNEKKKLTRKTAQLKQTHQTLADTEGELDAAGRAGFSTTWVIRPDDCESGIGTPESAHPRVQSFDEIVLPA